MIIPFYFIVSPSYCTLTLIPAHSCSFLSLNTSPHYFSPVCLLIFPAYAPLPAPLYPSRLSYLHLIPNIISFLFASTPMASIVYPSLPHTSLALSLSLSAILRSSLDPLSSPTLLSFSLYLSNLLLSSHVPVTLPEAVLSKLSQRARLDCSY